MTKRAFLCLLAGLVLGLGYLGMEEDLDTGRVIPGIMMGVVVARGLFVSESEQLRMGLYFGVPLFLFLIAYVFYSEGRTAGFLTLLWGLGFFGLQVKIYRTPT